MKILFLCTSLEPGRDGVGDYTRILAAFCARAGHACRLIALNDPHLPDAPGVAGASAVEETQNVTLAPPSADIAGAAPIPLPVLRLPATQTWPGRAARAIAWARDFAPDWQSWQVVSYGFHPKGVVPREARQLAAQFAHGPGRRHVMLHELWLGLSTQEPFRNRVTGALQRRALKKFIHALRPAALDTTNPAYLTALIRRDLAASHLPLFGNIPVAAPVAAVSGADSAGARANNPPDGPARFFTGVIFGTIHPQFLSVAGQAAGVLSAGARASGRSLRLALIGRSGPCAGELAESLAHIDLVRPGEMSPADISRELHAADFGIATHPWALIGKSGAVAAMLDHGLPVFVPRDDWTLRGRAAAPFSGYWPYASSLVERLASIPPEHMAGWLARRRAPAWRAPEIAAQFLERLASAASSRT